MAAAASARMVNAPARRSANADRNASANLANRNVVATVLNRQKNPPTLRRGIFCFKVCLQFSQIKLLVELDFFDKIRHVADKYDCAIIPIYRFGDNRDVAKIDVVGWLV